MANDPDNTSILLIHLMITLGLRLIINTTISDPFNGIFPASHPTLLICKVYSTSCLSQF